MKTWHVVLLVSAVALVGVVILMKSQQAKATPVNTSFASPGGFGALIGLATTAIPSIIGAFNKPAGTQSGQMSASGLQNIGFNTENYSTGANGFTFTDQDGTFVAG